MIDQKKNIVDKFGRTHDYLRISLTERCNLRCFYCMPEEGIQLRDKAEFMSGEELLDIAKTFVDLGVKKIRLTGGEPLIKKNAEHIIRELGKLPVELSITTNAVIVDRFIDVFKEAGIKSVNVSLDSLKEDRFNEISRRGYFTNITNNIDLLLKNDFNVKINIVVIKGVNEDEIVDFIEWTRNTPVHVRFIEFMPFDGNNWNWEKKVSYKEILDLAEAKYGGDQLYRIEDQPNDTARNFRLLEAKGTFAIISSVTNPFCDTCNRIRLTADGKIKNCLFSEEESDLLSAHRKNLPIEPIIRKAIAAKHKERGGLLNFSNEEVGKHKNRSMTSIGG
ncbi:MAG: molybdenum cofactor biosynthesis protein A [Crocinitomicaceae bacterium]|jgi:molybdenum cofactor biosynthesis protein A